MEAKGNDFFENVAKIIEQARKYVGRTVDLTMCISYFEIGRMIVEQEQDGKARAEYGHELLANLSKYLNERFGKGFSETNLRNARKFFQIYASTIQQSMIAELGQQKQKSLNSVFDNENLPSISQSLISEFYNRDNSLKKVPSNEV